MTDLNKNFLVISAEATITGNSEINEMIDNIIHSTPGTYLFYRSFGFINRVLFTNITVENALELKRRITNIVEDYLPFIRVDRVRSQCIPYPDEHYYLIQLYYAVLTTNTLGTYQNTMEVNN